MGNRLSRIYTRTGDDGTTGLTDGSRVSKDDARIETIGAVDELNSAIGVLRCETLPGSVQDCLADIQHTLFDIGGELSMPGHRTLTSGHVDALEHHLDEMNSDLPPLKEFILPGGSRAAAQCHMARTICRRAERRTFSLSKNTNINTVSLRYLNRLSDLLFVMARYLNREAGQEDVFWRHERKT